MRFMNDCPQTLRIKIYAADGPQDDHVDEVFAKAGYKTDYDAPTGKCRIGIIRDDDPEKKYPTVFLQNDDIGIRPGFRIELYRGSEHVVVADDNPAPAAPEPPPPQPQPVIPQPLPMENITVVPQPFRTFPVLEPIYLIGTGIADVTETALNIAMQGFANTDQKTTAVNSRLYARAFVIEEKASRHVCALVCADIWSGNMALKTEVLARLAQRLGNVFSHDNFWLAGTHTHSGPGGYNYHYLYNYAASGFDRHCFECIVTGIVRAIEHAFVNRAPGRIYCKQTLVENCGLNRSMPAYNANPELERVSYAGPTDREMLVLKFVRQEPNGQVPAGMLSWYAVHPTDLGQNNTYVSGDNKGFASQLFEQQMQGNPANASSFIAAFANANCGDVSGNVEVGHPPNNTNADWERMQRHGRQQFEAAWQAFNDPSAQEITGRLDFRHTFVDMQSSTGLVGAVGLSVFAGSREDGDPGSGLREGILAGTIEGDANPLDLIIRAAYNGFAAPHGHHCPVRMDLGPDQINGHHPKPIVMAPGAARPIPMVPVVIPFQLIRIGSFVIAGVPAELTTMAGRRLRKALIDKLHPQGVVAVALGTYANDYCGYITTPEEYQMQHYEGASNLFGPTSLAVYIGTLGYLADCLVRGYPAAAGAPLPNLMPYVINAKRITIRNKGTQTWHLSIRKTFTLKEIDLPGGADVGFYIPADLSDVLISFNGGPGVGAVPGEMIFVQDDGFRDGEAYSPRY